MAKACEQCGNEVPKRNKHFCSHACYGLSKRGKPQTKALARRPKFQCETCGKIFTRPPSSMKHDPPRFCGTKCFYKWLKGSERTPRVETNCLHCGKSMRVRASIYANGRGRYCSQPCMIAERPPKPRGPRVTLSCLHCNKEFQTYPSWAKDGRKFCSRQCHGAHTMRNARLMQPTSIERALMAELEKQEMVYEHEYPVTGWVLDFAFPDQRLAVEADGDYWHSLPNVIEKDARKDASMKAMGWRILHFTETQINQSVRACVDQVASALAQ